MYRKHKFTGLKHQHAMSRGWKMPKDVARAFVCDSPSADPTDTGTIRRRYGGIGDIRWSAVRRAVQSAVTKQDFLGLSPSSTANLLSSEGKTQAFSRWFETTVARIFSQDDWLGQMVRATYARALARARGLTREDVSPEDMAGSVAHLRAMALSELQGVIAAVQQRVVREAGVAMLHGDKPAEVARAMFAAVQMGATRTRALVEFMVAKTHVTATLETFRAAGVKLVGIIAELRTGTRDHFHRDARGPRGTGAGSRIGRGNAPSRSTVYRIRKAQKKLSELGKVNVETAGDDLVCQQCDDIAQGGPYTIDEAQSLIPAHPWCRCAFVPSEEVDILEE